VVDSFVRPRGTALPPAAQPVPAAAAIEEHAAESHAAELLTA
jgi:hypothetical protein